MSLLTEINSIVPVSKNLHIIARVSAANANDLLSNTLYDLAYFYDGAVGLYIKSGGAWVPSTPNLQFEFLSNTFDYSAPDTYIGVEHEGVIDSTWPPNIGDSNVYVATNWNTLLAYDGIKKGEIAVVNGVSYVLSNVPAAIPLNWVKLQLATSAEGSRWGKTASSIDTQGTMEVGKALDFHNSTADTSNYTYRFDNYALGEISGSGTFTATILKSNAVSATAGGSLVLAHGGNYDLTTGTTYWSWNVSNTNTCVLSLNDANNTNFAFITANPLDADDNKVLTVAGELVSTGSISDSVGNVRKFLLTATTGAYTILATDLNTTLAASNNITIPANVMTVGDTITVYNNTAANITITCSAMTAYIAGVNTIKTSIILATRGIATIRCTKPTEIVVTGNVT